MRLLFLFVLLVNVLFVGWEISQSEGDSLPDNDDASVPGIEMLSEIGQATKIPAEKPAGVPAKAGSRAEKNKQTQNSSGLASTTDEPSNSPSPAVPLNIETCFTLGPFRELDKLREFTRAIKDYVTTASFRSREEQEQSMFWVYLAPESSSKKAKNLAKQLKNKEIKDYYLITSGAQKNGVSLGHFKEKNRAYAHSESVKKLGFTPTVEPVFRSYTIYWLDYQVPAGKLIPQKIFNRHLTKKINRLDRSCS